MGKHFGWLALLAGFALAAATLPAPARAAPDLPPGVRLVDGYIPRFDQKKRMDARYGYQLDELRKQILKRGEAGEYLPCSSQILDEADWLIGSTKDEARIERRLKDLRESLAQPAQQQHAAGEQSPQDGSWGGCYEAWFLRMWASADPLKELVAQGRKPAHPLGFMKEVDSPQKIVERFRRLTTSRVLEDGIDNRKELNLTVTGLGQLLFLPSLAGLFPPDWPRGPVAAALIEYMDREWQDPKTGYWGAWYQVGDQLIKTEDLSMTFHIASYRDGKIERLPELIRTTFRTRERAYPYGWQDRGSQNCHHAYDVVRLVRFGWPHMSELQKAFARAQIAIILARTVRLSINTVGEVDTRPYNRVAEAYYFCTSLLDDIGYFRRSRNFWSNLEFDNADELREKMLDQIKGLPNDDPMIEAARRKLEQRD
ncbi:hypothetical protein FHP25_36130 [Vineibacter terrae]|uniref:Uncharacterized protein n=1 Tax=Vineibacter terrae TaxID=2586908 RepID=A0A5C8P8G9_9HYPH|nr:hypothetical protein [Vineibacter terrae]TXL70046.1 hypothetical protein FHP25_36130 [Vineibacter terrae]